MNRVHSHRLRREPTCTCAQCYYCGAWLARSHEHDHFPIPKAAGGRDVVPACVNCHDLKDRTPLEAWPDGLFEAGFMALVSEYPALRTARRRCSDMVLVMPGVEERWGRLSTEARLVYAKVLQLAGPE